MAWASAPGTNVWYLDVSRCALAVLGHADWAMQVLGRKRIGLVAGAWLLCSIMTLHLTRSLLLLWDVPGKCVSCVWRGFSLPWTVWQGYARNVAFAPSCTTVVSIPAISTCFKPALQFPAGCVNCMSVVVCGLHLALQVYIKIRQPCNMLAFLHQPCDSAPPCLGTNLASTTPLSHNPPSIQGTDKHLIQDITLSGPLVKHLPICSAAD